MSVYRYYLPGKKPSDVTDDMLVSLGLADRLRDCPLKRRGSRIELVEFNNRGPDGGAGVMVTPQPVDRKGVPNLRPENIAAHRTQHDADYWIVWDKTCPPTPEGLQRWETVPGVWEELGDGRLWQCPTVRTCIAYPALPKCYSRLNGQLITSVLPQYERVWHLSATWAVRLLEEYRETPFTRLLGTEGAFDAAVEALSINYRIADEEASLLGLLNDTTIDAVIDAAVDRAWFNDIADSQKKTALWAEVSVGFRSSLRGLVESTEDTNQAEPISS